MTTFTAHGATSRRCTLRSVLKSLLVTTAFCASFALAASTALEPGEGFVQVPGGPVWYRIFGSGNATPLLIVHGGPGMSSCIFDPLSTLVSRDRPVIVYDQLGSGRSGRPMDSSLWNADRSVRELAAVRDALGLRRVHLMGHSWGGAVVADYLITAKPTGVASLVLAGPLLSTKLWIDDANVLRDQLPNDVQEILTRNEAAGTVQSEEYEEATKVFYSRFLYHQADVKRPESCAQSPANFEIYQLMWGPSEFHATGNLSDFDVTPGLHQLNLPTLFVIGRYDEARLETITKFQAMVPGSSVKVLQKSGHMAPLEEYEEYAALLQDFLRNVDSRPVKSSPPVRQRKTHHVKP